MDYRPRLTSCIVKWNKHDEDLILNNDGNYMISTGRAGDGGIIRRENGNIVMVFANPIHFLTNNFRVVSAALFGVSWCYDQGYDNFRMELDSMIIVHMIKGTCNIL